MVPWARRAAVVKRGQAVDGIWWESHQDMQTVCARGGKGQGVKMCYESQEDVLVIKSLAPHKQMCSNYHVTEG